MPKLFLGYQPFIPPWGTLGDMADTAKKVYIVSETEETTLFETHFDELPLIGDFIDRPDNTRYEVLKRIHRLNTRGWADTWVLVVKPA